MNPFIVLLGAAVVVLLLVTVSRTRKKEAPVSKPATLPNEENPSSLLQYKTRGNASPNGRPRVYFCCHKEDFAATFGPITDELLDIQKNAAVWYRDPAADFPEDESFFFDLKQMQLFVIPVTSRFLYQEDPARTVEYAFAMENHIPVLPLIQENGLESEFNRICGDLQCLNKTAGEKDPTALPFTDKLKKYLSSTLVGEETTNRIRKAFRNYIFLSYRKKDRAHAQKVMHLIHTAPNCRDVAIWYDEFLTPGENYNREIEEALLKSRLFALVVTPSLLENPNYVQTVEYPAAMAQGMDIFPVEAVPTDHKKLADMYKGIGECFSTLNPERIQKQLEALFPDTASPEENEKPEHLYLIGLAYLSGIDVEINHERALDLITRAGEGKLPEACEKLVSMYRTGEGVSRDYATAIEWQKNLIASLFGTLKKRDPKQVYQEICLAQSDLCKYQLEAGETSEALQSAKNMEITARELVRMQCEGASHYVAASLDKQGLICRVEGKKKEAEEFFLQGLKIREDSSEKEAAAWAMEELPINYDFLGMTSEEEGNLRDARNWYEKSFAIREKMAEEKGTLYARRNLGISYDHLGTIFEKAGNLDQARDYYEKNIALSGQLALETGEMEDERAESLAYSRLGIIYRSLGNRDQAAACFSKSNQINEDLYRKSESLPSGRDFSVSLENLADMLLKEGKVDEAKALYEQSRAIREEVTKMTGTMDDFRLLAISSFKLGAVSEAENDFSKARSQYQESIRLTEEAPKKGESLEALQMLSSSYTQMGRMSARLGEEEEAGKWYAKSQELNGKIAEKSQSADALHAVFLSYYNQGIECHKQRKFQEARKWYEKSLEELEPKDERAQALVIRQDTAICLQRLGEIAQKENNFQEAKSYLEKSLNIREAIFEETGTPDAKLDLADTYEAFGSLAKAERQPGVNLAAYLGGTKVVPVLQKPEEYVNKCLQLRTEVLRDHPGPRAESDLFISYMTLGQAAYDKLAMEEAIGWYTKAMDLAKASRTSTSWRDLPVCYERLGDCYSFRKKWPEAVKILQMEIEAAETRFHETGDWTSKRHILVASNKLADVCEKEGKAEEALSWNEKCLETAEILVQKVSTVQSRKDCAMANRMLGINASAPTEKRQACLKRYLELAQGLAAEDRANYIYPAWVADAQKELMKL